MTRVLLILMLCSTVPLVAAPDRDELGRALASTRWIAYAPTHYFPNETPPVLPSDESLRDDMRKLRAVGFTGLVTYGARLPRLTAIAHEMGFTALLLGIWDPFNREERRAALDAVNAHRDLILGVVVGNEGLMTGRYTVDALCTAMREIQQATGKPVSSTETADTILAEPRLIDCSTFVSVNAHPLFANRRTVTDAVRWTVDAWDAVHARAGSKPVLFKEVGLPSRGAPELSEAAQRDYYLALARTPVAFAYFEAFDATPRFKDGVIEQSWGLWTAARQAKAIVPALPWRHGNPYGAEGVARDQGATLSLRELRALVAELAERADSALELCTVAELRKLVGDTAARRDYERAIARDPREPAYELLLGDYLRVYRGAGERPLFPEAEKHLRAARAKLTARIAAREKRDWDAATADRLTRSLTALYEHDGLPLAHRAASADEPAKASARPWLFLRPAFSFGRSTTDLDRVSDVQDLTSQALFSASSARLGRSLTNTELASLVHDVTALEVGAGVRIRHGSVPILDLSIANRHSDDLQVTRFDRPGQFNDVDLLDLAAAIEKPFSIRGSTDVLLGFRANRLSREGLIEFLPDATEHLTQLAVSGAVSHYVGPDRANVSFTYVHQWIAPVPASLPGRDRSLGGVTGSYQFFRPIFGRDVNAGLGRHFEPRGIDLFAGVLRDRERYPASPADVFIGRPDYFFGVTARGLGRFDVTVRPTWSASRISNDPTQHNTQLRIAGTLVARILDEERTAGMPSQRLFGLPIAFVHLVVPVRWDEPRIGLDTYRSRRAGAELWIKLLAAQDVGINTLAVVGYSKQHFPNIGRDIDLLSTRISIGF